MEEKGGDGESPDTPLRICRAAQATEVDCNSSWYMVIIST